MITLTVAQLFALVLGTAGLTALTVGFLCWRTEQAARAGSQYVEVATKRALEISATNAETVHSGLTVLLETAAAMQQGQVTVLDRLSSVITRDYNSQVLELVARMTSAQQVLRPASAVNSDDAAALALLARQLQEGAPEEAISGLTLRDTIPAGELTGNAQA